MIDMSRRRFIACLGTAAAIAPAEPTFLVRLLERIRSRRVTVPVSGTGDELITVRLVRAAAMRSSYAGYIPLPDSPRYIQTTRREAAKIVRFYSRLDRGSAVILHTEPG